MAGFIVRNRTGMIVWGENNSESGKVTASPNEVVTITFEFVLPFIAPGTYSISAAVSEGDPSTPIPMHYKPDMMVIEPIIGKRAVHGILAIADMSISTQTKQ